ncbi:MAG: hypothetical protein WC479_10070 [Candidatus Izemoplasmatales bacterium]
MYNCIKLEIQGQGDRSVGIEGENTAILIERRFISGDYGDENDCRNWIRDKVVELFKELFDDSRVTARFEDECWDCGKIKSNCKCEGL